MSSADIDNINDKFFDGHYKDIWRSIIPEGLTRAEIEFLVSQSSLKQGDNVLDLMCGYGRHVLGLSRQGIRVTGVDNLADYINEIQEIVYKENLPATLHQDDVMQFRTKEEYDLVICMGNSISFFNKKESSKLFSLIAACLKKNHKFIFHTWMLAEIFFKNFTERTWNYVGDIKFLVDNNYLISPSRVETDSIFITPDGKTELKKAVDYIYSLNETEELLSKSGLAMTEVWSIPGKKKFTIGDSRAYIVAEKT